MLFHAPNPVAQPKLHQTVIILLMAVLLGFPAMAMPLSSLTIGHAHFTVEESRSEKEHETGLMHRSQLAANQGMLFIFASPQKVAMWMKDTPLPLDMLFIDAHGKIVFIKENATPESLDVITTDRMVKAVLELAGGTCQKQGIHVGDKVNHALFDRPHR